MTIWEEEGEVQITDQLHNIQDRRGRDNLPLEEHPVEMVARHQVRRLQAGPQVDMEEDHCPVQEEGHHLVFVGHHLAEPPWAAHRLNGDRPEETPTDIPPMALRRNGEDLMNKGWQDKWAI